MATENYFKATSEQISADETAMAELKTFAIGAETAERRHQTTLRASAEYNKRVRRVMLFNNLGYEAASRVVADQDSDLMCLYVFGELKD